MPARRRTRRRRRMRRSPRSRPPAAHARNPRERYVIQLICRGYPRPSVSTRAITGVGFAAAEVSPGVVWLNHRVSRSRVIGDHVAGIGVDPILRGPFTEMRGAQFMTRTGGANEYPIPLPHLEHPIHALDRRSCLWKLVATEPA